MKKIDWKPEYSVQNAVLDKQHRGLLDLYNQTVEKYDVGDDMYDVFEALANYIAEHLESEEALMREKNFARYLAHKKEHDSFRTRVMDLMVQYNNESPLVKSRLGWFISDWLKTHIFSETSEDQSYKGLL